MRAALQRLGRRWQLASSLLLPAREGRPDRVTAILTESCHLRCDFCRLWEQPDSGASVDDWLRFFQENSFLKWVNLSGGEIFQRPVKSGKRVR